MYAEASARKCVDKSVPLIYDEACLDVNNLDTRPLLVKGQYWDCWLCDDQALGVVKAGQNSSFLIDTKYDYKTSCTTINDNIPYCTTGYWYQEHGVYGWNLSHESCSAIYIKEAPDNAYLPILGACIVFLLFGTIWYGLKCVYKSACTSSLRSRVMRFSDLENDLGRPPTSTAHPQIHIRPGSGRIKSLDVFRGLAVILMIFVNYGGGQYWFFKHSVWDGLTIADLVFPWFAWVMGVSLALSVRAWLRAGITRKRLIWRAYLRALYLILFGIMLNTVSTNYPVKEDVLLKTKDSGWTIDEWGTELSKVRNPTGFDNLRIPGVLQRLSVAGFVVSILEITFMMVHSSAVQTTRFPWMLHLQPLSDIVDSAIQWIIVLLLVIAHTCITFLYQPPGCPNAGLLSAGGLAHHGDYVNCTGGAAGYIDRQIFGESHLYQNPTFKKMYQNDTPYDPEGLLGTLTTILCIYLGVQAGKILLTYNNPKSRVIRLFSWALITGIIGGYLCGYFNNDGPIPVNKNLWSLSYVLVTSSLAFIIFTIIYLLVDVTKHWGGRPLFYPGMNPLFLYIGHTITKNMFPFAWAPSYYSHREFVIMNLWGTFLWIVVAIFLYKKRILISF